MKTKSDTQSPSRRRPVRAWCSALLLTAALGRSLHAEIPEPENVFYGNITLGVTPVTAAQTNIVVEARKLVGGPVIASYRMGANPAYGNRYSIEIPLEAFFPLSDTNASRVGAVVYLSVQDGFTTRDTRTAAIAQRGQLVRLDFTEADADGDGLPDRWEQQYFSSATGADPNGDPDGDGRNNLQEFVDGTNPLVPDGRHPADRAPADNLVTLDESESYAAAWLAGQTWSLHPTNIPIAYVARAAALALRGTPYLFTNSPPTNAPMWWVSTPYTGPGPVAANQAAALPLPASPAAGSQFTVTLQVGPTNSVTAFAVQDQPPSGWTNIQNISHGGAYDVQTGQVKWGPFYDNVPRDLTYDLVVPASGSASNTFVGIASFDGYNVPISGQRTILSGPLPPLWILSQVAGPNVYSFTLLGSPTTPYVIERTTNFVNWSVLRTNFTDAGGRFVLWFTNNPAVPSEFFRARYTPTLGGNPAMVSWIASQRTAGNAFSFTLQGSPNTFYAIEATTNFTSWSVLQTNLTDVGGRYVLNVTNNPTLPARCFRARYVP